MKTTASIGYLTGRASDYRQADGLSPWAAKIGTDAGYSPFTVDGKVCTGGMKSYEFTVFIQGNKRMLTTSLSVRFVPAFMIRCSKLQRLL